MSTSASETGKRHRAADLKLVVGARLVLRRRHARHPRLSAEPHRLGAPDAPAHGRQEPRREGRMHSVSRRPARAHRGPQSHRDAAGADRRPMRSCNLLARLKSAPLGSPSGSPPACSIAATTAAASRGSQRSPRSIVVPLIAVNDVLYHAPERRPLQDVVTCIREHVTIDKAGRLLEANAERHLKRPQEMARLFRRAPEAIDRTLRFLERCNFSLEELENTEYPDENRVGFATPQDALVALVEEGARRRYPNGVSAKVRDALDRELEITAEARIRALLPHRPRHRPLRALQGHPVPGARLGGEFRHLLLPRHHRGRSREGRSSVRALRLRGAQGAARHRRRFRARAARGGDPVHLQKIRPPSRRTSPPPSSAIAGAARSARSARRSGCPTTPSARSPACCGAGRSPA